MKIESPINPTQIQKLLKVLEEAGRASLEIYQRDFAIDYKTDQSPVTEADHKVNEILTKSLQKLFPDTPILSEESKEIPFSIRKNWNEFWLIDPIDGTKEFIKKNGEFTLNLALIRAGHPVLGFVYAPVLKRLYYGGEDLGGSYVKTKLGVQKLPLQPSPLKRALVSRSHLDAATNEFLHNLFPEGIEQVPMGSSLKMCRIAEGNALIYPKLGPTMEWDTAAAHALLKTAGGNVYQLETKKELDYNKSSLYNPHFICARE